MTDVPPPPPLGVPDPEPQPEHRVRKRRRRTMACVQCRSRKLRCDRKLPMCSRCESSKTAVDCTYEKEFLWQQPNTVVTPAFSERGPTATNTISQAAHLARTHPTPDSALSSFTRSQQTSSDTRPALEKRDRFLETVLGAPKAAVNQEPYVNTELLHRSKHPGVNHHAAPSHHHGDDEDSLSPSQQLGISPRIMMRGKETKTRFNGSGIFANLIAQFPDIKSFAEEIRVASPQLSALRPDLARVKRGLWKRKPLNTPFPEPTTLSLTQMLPSRRVVDDLVVLYLTYFEATHRILHVPSFLKELDEFWAQRDNPDFVSPHFVVQLLLVLACAWNLADFDTLQLKNDNESDLTCYTAIEWVLHAERWIENSHIKRPDIMAFRLYILLLVAKNAHGMKRSKAWLDTGTLIKQAMLAGYHRDPSRYTKISPFNKEMRRRIWTTIVELDLEVSLERGMPPALQYGDYDTAPALNLNDNELQETSEELPAERPLSEITGCSFQSVLIQSLPLRLKACKLMHSPRISCSYDEILHLDWELNRYLSQIPSWTVSEDEDLQTQHKVILIRSLLQTKICHSLLSIHTPFAIEAPQETLFAPSARTRLEVATMILSTQRQLHETSRQLSLSILGDWTVQAYCSVCQLLHASTNSQASSRTSLPQTLPGLPESLITLAEMTLTCLETQLLLVVKGAKEYFFMSTILDLVKARLWPAQATVYKQEVVDRVIFFAQTLFTRHAHCDHLGELGMGGFKTTQVPVLNPSSGMAQPFVPNMNMLQPTNFGITQSGELDPFLDAFDWGDLTGITFEGY
ncbi:putative C6 transcription factor [Aspergillus pseudonomiae]|uniref:Putative C6 transcription factor n=1 Tax=Aspergillus pseudonomiae TaxID=1506151 RepID=A0A5N6I2C3_9EURO|nr:putative C6 transcription factor [Aspergillus pseudonomiae]KAB8260197.1 putative C6 transcription factor [Aspergillus pseudonomiae]KAE8407198.1 putative C6 transcription factor [Aspergillus pseudonomiae]